MRALLVIFLLFFIWSCSSDSKNESNNPPVDATLDADKQRKETGEAIDASLIDDDLRTEWQNPELVLNLLGDLTNKEVADIGAGSGYFTFKMARRAKKVIALDIDPKSLEYIQSQKSIVGDWADNIETRLTPADVPNLIENEVDLVLIVNTYAFIPNKPDYLKRLKNGMKSGGRLVIIDFKTGDVPVGPSDETKISANEVMRSLKLAGFSKTKLDLESLQYQYIIITEN